MKKICSLSLIAALVFISCNSAPEADEAKTEEQKEVAVTEGEVYKVDSTQVAQFIGTKPVGQHQGTFNVTGGEFFVKNEAILTGGKLTFDINSLQITDKDTSGAHKLKGHLLSPDFFDATNHPAATFEITSVEEYVPDSTNKIVLDGATNTIKGNLTLKGVTKNVAFPAAINITPAAVTARANFNINRTDWGLVYGNDQSLGDKFIRPEVNVSFNITASK
ncbi:YceI family protein [Niabella insulamsoli]|uniref:YceI family protein n=1 Tax=Niabella insulamsoli TaxID=3144874 RepID=UPI0031FE41FA